MNFEKSCIMNCVTKKSLSVQNIFSREGQVIENVSSLKLLGITFSPNLSWNDHFSVITSKCYKRFFILRNLKQAGCSSALLYKCYVAFIQSLMLYGFPSFCNSPKYLIKKFLRVERRASRFFSDYDFPSFVSVSDNACKSLFLNIASNPNHSLRCMFNSRTATPRDPSTLCPPFSKTARFSNSFIKYARR